MTTQTKPPEFARNPQDLEALTDEQLAARLNELTDWLASGRQSYRPIYEQSRYNVAQVMATRAGRIGRGL
jgi:hypothetical protein